jgi:hypothetical protein
MLFVLLFLPGTSLSSWNRADAPHLHELMQTGARALMNARTAEKDRITTSGGERTIYAGARSAEDAAELATTYDQRANNLQIGLAGAGIPLLVSGALPQQAVIQSPKVFVENLSGNWPDIDARIGHIASWVQTNHGLLMVLSPNPPRADYSQMRQLTPVLVWGKSVPAGYLYSPSTRTDGLITNTDIAPTIAAYMDAKLPIQPFGAVLQVRPETGFGVENLLHREGKWASQAVAMKLLPYFAGMLATYIFCVVMFSRGKQELYRRVAAFAVLLPLILILSHTIFAVAFLYLAAMFLVGLFDKPASVSLMAAIIIVLLVTVDAIGFGGRIIGSSMLGYSPIEGARYYGIGNEEMGAYFGALVVVTGLLIRQGQTRLYTVAPWVLAAVCLALPTAGAKAGGVVVCGASIAALLCLQRGKKLTDVTTVLSVVAGCFCAVAVIIAASHFGPKTHIAGALSMAKTTGAHTIVQTVLRKAGMDLHLVFHSVWIWVLVLSSYGRWKLRVSDISASVGTVAILTCLLFNDAGVVAAALCSLIIWADEHIRSAGPAWNLSGRLTNPGLRKPA